MRTDSNSIDNVIDVWIAFVSTLAFLLQIAMLVQIDKLLNIVS